MDDKEYRKPLSGGTKFGIADNSHGGFGEEWDAEDFEPTAPEIHEEPNSPLIALLWMSNLPVNFMMRSTNKMHRLLGMCTHQLKLLPIT